MFSRVGDGEIEVTDGKNRLTLVVEYKPGGPVRFFRTHGPNIVTIAAFKRAIRSFYSFPTNCTAEFLGSSSTEEREPLHRRAITSIVSLFLFI